MDSGLKTGTDILRLDYDETLRKTRENGVKLGFRPRVTEVSVQARVNHDRWLADCECGAGIACDPTWPYGLCIECGRQTPIVWPDKDTRQRIGDLLTPRKATRRSWEVTDDAVTLIEENVKAGLVVSDDDAALVELSAVAFEKRETLWFLDAAVALVAADVVVKRKVG